MYAPCHALCRDVPKIGYRGGTLILHVDSGYPLRKDRGLADSLVQVYFLGALIVVHFRHQFVQGHFCCVDFAPIRDSDVS